MAVTPSFEAGAPSEKIGFRQGWCEYRAVFVAVWSKIRRSRMLLLMAIFALLMSGGIRSVDMFQKKINQSFEDAFHSQEIFLFVATLLIARFSVYWLYSGLMEWFKNRVTIPLLIIPLVRDIGLEMMRRVERLTDQQHREIDANPELRSIAFDARGIVLTKFREKAIEQVAIYVQEPAVIVVGLWIWYELITNTPKLFAIVILIAAIKILILVWANSKIKPYSEFYAAIEPTLESADIELYKKIRSKSYTEADFHEYENCWREYVSRRVKRDLKINDMYNLFIEGSNVLSMIAVAMFAVLYYVYETGTYTTGETGTYIVWAFAADDFMNMLIQVMRRWATDRPFFMNALRACGWWDEVYRPPVR